MIQHKAAAMFLLLLALVMLAVTARVICGILATRCRRECPHVSCKLTFGTPRNRS